MLIKWEKKKYTENLPKINLQNLKFHEEGRLGHSGLHLHFSFFFYEKGKKGNVLTKIPKHVLKSSCYVKISNKCYLKKKKKCAHLQSIYVPHLRCTVDESLLLTLN